MNTLKLSTIMAIAIGFITSCDAPRERRTTLAGSTSQNSLQRGPSSNFNGDSGNGNNNSNGNGNSSGQNTNNNIPSEISKCSWSMDGATGFASSNKHFSPNGDDSSVGGYTVCQSDNDEKNVYIQLQSPPENSQICLIPTRHEGSSSIYIGEPRCLRIYENKKIYKVSLLKNRRGNYSQFKITGVMVMKDKAYFFPSPFYQWILAPDAYTYCSEFLAQYNDASYCQAFKQINQYVYHQFSN